ncbi:MAG: hypothetical protein ABIW76_11235 [Fibrobacteria bacterium]
MSRFFLIASALCLSAVLSHGEGIPYEVHGQAWSDFGRIGKASDFLLPGGTSDVLLDLNGNPILSMGAQFTVKASLGENWEGAFGFGAHKISHALGHGQKSFLTISMFQNFLTESRLTWFSGEKENPNFSITAGSFPYKYHANVQNLGLYLFRGPVYPGALMGGFQDFAVDSTKSTQLGAKFHHAMGNFSHDIILNSERELPPTFDWSLGYVAKYKAFDALEFGAGANFYRLFAYDKKLQTPGKLTNEELQFEKARYIEVDSATGDTVFFTHKGIKTMAMFSLDFKPLFGIESLSRDDLKLYGEAAIIGVQNYGKTYGDIADRIPVMLGFNLPTFKWLDHIALEVEYYGSPYRNDLVRLGNNNTVAPWTLQKHPIPSPKPAENADYKIDANGNWKNAQGDTIKVNGTGLARENVSVDNLKWSLYLDKTISNHIHFIAQVANDHYRPRPIATGLIDATGGTAEAFSEASNWYFMLRAGYFF